MGRSGHSQEMPSFKHLLTMTNSQFPIKELFTVIHPYYTIVNADKTQTNMGNFALYKYI